MGKKRSAVGATTVPPVFPFPAAAGEPDAPHHFSDYGFDPQLLRFFSQPEAKRPSSTRRHHQHQHQPPPLEAARFKLQKPISKKHGHHQKQQQRRRWWSSAASAALLLFKRPSSSSSASPAAAPASPYGSAASPAGPLYLAVDDGSVDDGPAACACPCWAPAMRSGHLAASELGAAAMAVPYVSLRSASLRGGAGGGGAAAAPAAMPIYLVT